MLEILVVKDGDKKWRITKDQKHNMYWLELMVIDVDMDYRSQDNGTLKNMLQMLERSIGYSAIALS